MSLSLSGLLLFSLENRLDLVGVDDLGDVGVLEDTGVESVARLELRSRVGRTVQVVESSDGGLGPDAESTEVTSGSQMSDVESVDVEEVDSGDVSDGSLEVGALVVADHEGTSSVLESSVSELALTSSDLLGVSDSQDILSNSEILEDLDGFLGLGDVVDIVGEDQRELGNAHDSMSSGNN